MAFARTCVIILLIMATVSEVSKAASHRVQDSDCLDYNKWAASRKKTVGETIVFNYNNKPSITKHIGMSFSKKKMPKMKRRNNNEETCPNVLQVSEQDYIACNIKAPIATFSSGEESLKFDKVGHYYFLCGIADHCKQEMKMDIKVASKSGGAKSALPALDQTSSDRNTLSSLLGLIFIVLAL